MKWEKDTLPHLGDFFVQVGRHVYGPSSSGQVLHHFHQHTSQPFAFNLLFFPPRKAFCQLSKRTFLFVKKKRTFLEALWQSPASLSLAQQLLLFCLGPEKDPDKSCDMVFYHELRSSHSFLFDLVSKSTVEKSDTFFSRQTQSWIIFRNLKIIIKNMNSTGTGTISMDI